MNVLAIWKNRFYEGDYNEVHAVVPMPVLSTVKCEFIKEPTTPGDQVVFREDDFDPVTRIRRGRLYIGGPTHLDFGQVIVNGLNQHNWLTMPPSVSYTPWNTPSTQNDILGQHIRIGSDGFETLWRIIGVEKLTIGHILLTLRATSLLGTIPDLADQICDLARTAVNRSLVIRQLDALVDTSRRQQEIATVDAARETARVVLAAWIGECVSGKDLKDVITNIPDGREVIRSAAFIINRLHPRGKSAEHESRAADGSIVRTVDPEDAETSVHLVGMILREIGWTSPN
ncbi:hypothetical protein [Acidihalobacter yilgarnensis]|uniref:hypothetical protein n=1 Tax=Acidihalobacter yilgarnensis TaxID=2819280 RepID=UPI0012EA8E87|nr:hypothetical protein [Acidihalobacter yilgarnensis]